MSDNTNILVAQEGQERCGKKAVAGTTDILKNGNYLVDTEDKFDADRI